MAENRETDRLPEENRYKGLLERISERPTLAMKFVIWVSQAFIGLVILLPNFKPTATPSLNDSFSNPVLIKVYGALLFFPAVLALILMLRYHIPATRKLRQGLMFWSFLMFSYFTAIRLVQYGFTENLIWVSYFINAAIAGIIHLRLKWENT